MDFHITLGKLPDLLAAAAAGGAEGGAVADDDDFGDGFSACANEVGDG